MVAVKKMDVIKKGNEIDVLKLEKKLEFSFPLDYKEFITKYDGVRFYHCKFYVERLRQEVLMDVLYGITGEKRFDLMKNNKYFEGEIPDKSLIIGEDPGGTPILLICDGKNDGIYIFDSNYFFKESSDEENTFFIANTFTSFFNMLNPSEIYYR
jgi:hypothetical protein